jgi:hypothetical protein
MPSSPSRPPLIRICLLQELTLTIVTKLGHGVQFGCLRVHKSAAHQPFAGDWGRLLMSRLDITPASAPHDELHR